MQANAKMLEASELSKLIGKIGKQKVTLDNQIQIAAAECVAQSIVHRNATPAMQLFEVLGSNMRRDALVAYFEKFGNLAWSKEAKRLSFFDVEKLVKGATALEWTEEYADTVRKTLWQSLKKEPEVVSAYDVEVEFQKFFKRLERLASDPAISVKNKEMLNTVKAAYLHCSADLAQKSTKVDDTVIEAGKQVEIVAANRAKEAGNATPEQLAMLAEHFNGESAPQQH
jgi:hypothetical protein